MSKQVSEFQEKSMSLIYRGKTFHMSFMLHAEFARPM